MDLLSEGLGAARSTHHTLHLGFLFFRLVSREEGSEASRRTATVTDSETEKEPSLCSLKALIVTAPAHPTGTSRLFVQDAPGSRSDARGSPPELVPRREQVAAAPLLFKATSKQTHRQVCVPLEVSPPNEYMPLTSTTARPSWAHHHRPQT